MKFKNSNSEKVFFNEVRVGSMPGVQKVGPRIYAWKIENGVGKYIMDNFVRGDSSLVTMSLNDYMITYFPLKCPPKSHPVFKKLKKVLTDFWTVTKGYHGDLHFDNIAVVMDKDVIKRIMIFDYGSHKKFKASVNKSLCFEDYIRVIEKEFFESTMKQEGNVAMYYPPGTQIKLYEPKTGQLRRSNVNMIRGHNYRGVAIANSSFNQSAMTKLAPTRNVIRQIQNRSPGKSREDIVNMLRKQTAKNPNVHRQYFMTKENWNKMLKPKSFANRLKNIKNEAANIRRILENIKKVK